MGNNLQILKDSSNNKDTFLLLKKSLFHLKENFCAFKALCDNFFLDITQFQTIFGLTENSFPVWDIDKNGLIDAFELFAGLIICSIAKIDDKVRFLFEIFDLNEVGFLEIIDVQFMLYSVLSSTFKIFGIKREIDVNELSDVVDSYFSQKLPVIKVTLVMQFAREFQPVLEFFQLIAGDHESVPNRAK